MREGFPKATVSSRPIGWASDAGGIRDREELAPGAFRAANQMLTYLTPISPVILFRATAPIRAALAKFAIVDTRTLDSEMFVAYLKSAAVTVLTAAPSGKAVQARPMRPRARTTRSGDHA